MIGRQGLLDREERREIPKGAEAVFKYFANARFYSPLYVSGKGGRGAIRRKWA